jgi:nickel/cobalt exporter
MTMFARRIRGFVFLLLMLAVFRLASAHPMGNFSVNHYSRITLENNYIRVYYFVDLAEIPTYQELQQANIPASAIDPNSPTVINYVAARGAELGRGLILDVDSQVVPLRLVSSGVIFPPGAGGLPTMKMGFVYDAAYPSTLNRQYVGLHYADKNYDGRAGWKEITALAFAGSLRRSSVPATDRSTELSNYPTDLLTSPPQDLEATVLATLPPLTAESRNARPLALSRGSAPSTAGKVRAVEQSTGSYESGLVKNGFKRASVTHVVQPGKSIRSTSAAPTTMYLRANRQQTPRSRFTELIQAQNLSAWFLFTAALIAIGLGGLHALEPGHGKTIVAAYLVGSRGTASHAFLLGLIVTVSHTAGVFALGAITLYASRYIVPEQLYPWLGALSGITIAVLGCSMLLRRLTGTASDHSHTPGSSHGHWTFWKRAGTKESENQALLNDSSAQPVTLTQLFALGITGGMIPCPAALIVLLSAFALHRIGLGFFLIVAFSVGLAGMLISFGMLMVYARHFITRLRVDGPLTTRWLPIASSAFITVLGLTLAVQALSSAHLDVGLFSKEKLGPILFVVGLGLILGMRHSTDADHVVAISTIVSKQRSIRDAAVIGSMWGLGHTITVFVVGSLIILFGIEIPPRLGLSMEFIVAVMLIVLGVLNLTGVMQRMATFFTPAIGGLVNSPSATGMKAKSLFDNPIGRLGFYQCFRPLAIGLVHGLAGSAAVALLVLSTIHDPVWASVYLLIFGAGTMFGMMCMTVAIAVPLSLGGDRFAKMGKFLAAASGMASLCFGSFLVYQLGFLGGLFTSHPQWTPR